jgi:hypothetical protein
MGSRILKFQYQPESLQLNDDPKHSEKLKLERTDYITRLKEAYQRHTALEKSKATGEPDENHVPDKRTEI